MEDLRDAEQSVAAFAALIDRLQPDATTTQGSQSPELTKRQGSNSSQKSIRWRPKKKEWHTSTEGALWNELEKPLRDVAEQYGVKESSLNEFVSSRDVMGFGSEFVRHYGDYLSEKSYWAAEDLFFDLQSVKQGDAGEARWTAPRVYKKDWDLANHLVRFVLLAEKFRMCANREDWNGWEWNFANKVGFYLSILRCFTVKDAKQRQLAKQLSQSSKHSKHSRQDAGSPAKG